jgi:hypothetical protein
MALRIRENSFHAKIFFLFQIPQSYSLSEFGSPYVGNLFPLAGHILGDNITGLLLRFSIGVTALLLINQDAFRRLVSAGTKDPFLMFPETRLPSGLILIILPDLAGSDW